MPYQTLQPSPIEARRQQDHPHCFVCDPQRTFGLQVVYAMQSDGTAAASITCPAAWEGYPGMVHGGITACLVDGAMTNCLFGHDISAVTIDLQLQYRHPLAVGKTACISAKVTRRAAPLFELIASITQEGRVCATATGKFMDRQYGLRLKGG